jgi:CheY-like chemotaxis protein
MATKILIVDDYTDTLLVWTLFFEMCGFEVLAAADGRKAVAYAHQKHPDLAVVDLELPELSGCEVAHHLRHSRDTASIPLIAVTGHSDTNHVEAARRAGFDVVLTKPCDPTTLMSTIRGYLPVATAQGLGL